MSARSSTATHTNLSILLKLPQPLEQQFWADASTRRILCSIDIAAACLPFCNVLTVAWRRIKDVPEEVNLPVGARLMLLGYLLIHLTILLLLATQPDVYWRRRTALIKLGRCWRLGATVLWTHPQTVIGYGTQTAAVGKAALSGHISRALLISIFVPTAMHLQHTHLHLPFSALLPFQLCNFIVAVVWSMGMPCWLTPGSGVTLSSSSSSSSVLAAGSCRALQRQCPQLFGANLITDACRRGSNSSCWPPVCAEPTAASVEAAAVLQTAAEEACSRVQMVQLLLSVALPAGIGIHSLSAQQLCTGPVAFQVLYLHVAVLLLLVLPLTCYYTLERFLKTRWLKSKGIAVDERSPGTLFLIGPAVNAPPVYYVATDGEQTVVLSQPSPPFKVCWWQAMPVLVLLLVQLPWVVAQALASWMHGECAPPLGGPAFSWMGGMW